MGIVGNNILGRLIEVAIRIGARIVSRGLSQR
jgi:hypothetical protein